ncbi:hypothetical protein ACWD4G_27745 [Streptomyces sp. NPDC002643]
MGPTHLDDLFTDIGHRFDRVEPRRRMRDSVRGSPLAPVARKKGLAAGRTCRPHSTASAGVQRPYSGTVGRTENSCWSTNSRGSFFRTSKRRLRSTPAGRTS